MIETVGLVLRGYEDRPAADLRLVNGRTYGIFDTGDGSAAALLRALAGAEEPAAGTVRIGGFDTVTEPEKAGLCLGYCSSETGYYGDMTVWELMSFIAGMRGESGTRGTREIHAVLDGLGLDEDRNRLLSALDRDGQRRAGLAQALIGNPAMLFLDRPTKGLEYEAALALREDIRRITESDKTVFLVSDSAAELAGLCDRFLFCDRLGITPPLAKADLMGETPTPAQALFLKRTAQDDLSADGEEETDS